MATTPSSSSSAAPAATATTTTTAAAPAPAPAPTSVPLLLGSLAPDFTANTTHGKIKFSEFATGKYVILFSHPEAFTPVCSTEFVEFARLSGEFTKRNCALMGCSVDGVRSNIAWVRDIESKFKVTIPFPVICDLTQTVARLYGMVHEPTSVTATVRCVFFIDPARTLRALIYYPMQVGRNMEEILRVLDALQMVDKYGVACPANWTPGKPVIVGAPNTAEGAAQRVADNGKDGMKVTEWYFTEKPSPVPSTTGGK